MTCCCAHSSGAARFFSRFARRYRRRFERRGLERSQRDLVAAIERAGCRDATVLEIGCGVGHLHQLLLEHGARAAVGIDLAPEMIAEARRWAAERGLDARTRYLEGDFVEMHDAIDAADVTVLDKVVCCYPDAELLVDRSIERTRHVYALTIPRDRWFTRIGAELLALGMRVIGSAFRPYVHSPERIDERIRARGWRLAARDETIAWMSLVYEAD